jgi:hypothetical protein
VRILSALLAIRSLNLVSLEGARASGSFSVRRPVLISLSGIRPLLLPLRYVVAATTALSDSV